MEIISYLPLDVTILLELELLELKLMLDLVDPSGDSVVAAIIWLDEEPASFTLVRPSSVV